MELAQHDSFEGPQSESPGPRAAQLGGWAAAAPEEEEPVAVLPVAPLAVVPLPDEATPDELPEGAPPLLPHPIRGTSDAKIRALVALAPIAGPYL
jgi:hypothetical protein